MSEPKQEIPIEVVEVSPNETHTPQKTSFRATKDSIAGGKALPKRPVFGVKLANSNAHKASDEIPFDLTVLSPAKVFQPSLRQQKAQSPNLSLQQPKPPKTNLASATIPLAPKSKKIAIAPTTPPAPKVEPTVVKRVTTLPVPKPKKTALARATTPPVPNPKNLGQSGTLLSGRTPYTQPSLKTGAASLLGGTVSVSSRNFNGDYLAAFKGRQAL